MSIHFSTTDPVLKDVGYGRYSSKSFTIGDEDEIKGLHAASRFIDRLTIDGYELEVVRRQFSNIPITDGHRPCVWCGEMAQFIALNLVSEL